MEQANWFIAKLIFEIETGKTEKPQFDEQFRLIDAINEELALEIAYQLGNMHQDAFENKNKDQIRWSFVAVTEIYKIDNVAHGAEVYYRITEPDDAKIYLDTVNGRAEHLKNKKLI